MEKIPRIEQETIINYNVELDQWEVYSCYPPHVRKYRDKLNPIMREEFYSDGTEKLIDGIIEGSVSVRGKVKLSNKQKQERAERLRKMRESNV